MLLFFLGVLEMIVSAAWTKAVSTSRVWPSGLITVVNIMIWYFVLQSIIEDITNWRVVAVYALGCAVGTMLTTQFFSYSEKKRRVRKSKEASTRALTAYADRTPIGGSE